MVNMFTEISKMKASCIWSNPALPGSGSGFTAGNTQEGEDTNDDGILDAETELALNYVPTVFSGESELALASLLATIDLDYNDKYGLFASVRRDEPQVSK